MELLGLLSLTVVGYQLAILGLMLAGSTLGRWGWWTAIACAVGWTLTHVAFPPLMVLQFGTVAVGALLGYPLSEASTASQPALARAARKLMQPRGQACQADDLARMCFIYAFFHGLVVAAAFVVGVLGLFANSAEVFCVAVGWGMLAFLLFVVPPWLLGRAIFHRKRSARFFALVFPVISVGAVPFGTALGLYSFAIAATNEAWWQYEANQLRSPTIGARR